MNRVPIILFVHFEFCNMVILKYRGYCGDSGRGILIWGYGGVWGYFSRMKTLMGVPWKSQRSRILFSR